MITIAASRILHNYPTIFSVRPLAASNTEVSSALETEPKKCRVGFDVSRTSCLAVERELGAQSFRGNTE